ncbi:MAG: aminoglycoside phosphotransferase family protein [bacterium]
MNTLHNLNKPGQAPGAPDSRRLVPQKTDSRISTLAPEMAAVQASLQQQMVSESRLASLKLVWIKIHPQEGLRLLYQAESEDEQHYFFGRSLPLADGLKYEAKINRLFSEHKYQTRLQRFRQPAIYSAELSMLFQFFPADWRLPFLVPATDAEVMRKILTQVLGTERDAQAISAVSVKVVQYKPQRKCLIQYQLQLHAPNQSELTTEFVYGKVFRKAERVFENLQKIHGAWHSSVFEIPRPLGLVPELRLMLLSHLPGRHLSLLTESAGFGQLCQEIARGLLEFQQTPVLLDEVKGRSDELRELNTWGEEFARAWPKEAGRIRRLVAILGSRLTCAPLLQGLVHGDFHVANLLVDSERLGLLDFENCFMGNPAIDVGSFYAQLKLLSLKVYADSQALQTSIEAFLETYLRGCTDDVRESVSTYCALSCLWCAYFQCLLRPVKAGWLERAHVMLQLCEEILAKGFDHV